MAKLGVFSTSRSAAADLPTAHNTADAKHGCAVVPSFHSAVANLLHLARTYEEPAGDNPGKSLWPSKSLTRALDGLSVNEVIHLPRILSPDNLTALPQAKTRAQIIEQLTIALSNLPKELRNDDKGVVARDATGKAISLHQLTHPTRSLQGVIGEEQVGDIKAYLQDAVRRICEYHHSCPDYTDFGYHQREQLPSTGHLAKSKPLAYHLKKKMPGYRSKQAAKQSKMESQQESAAKRLLTIEEKKPFAKLKTIGELKSMIRSHEAFQATGPLTNPRYQKSLWRMSMLTEVDPRQDWQQLIREDGNPVVNIKDEQFCIPRRAVCPLTDLIDSMGLLAGISGAGFQELAKQYGTPASRKALHQSIAELALQELANPLAAAKKKRLEAIEIMTRPIGYTPSHFHRPTITLLELDDPSLFEKQGRARPDGKSRPSYLNLDVEIPEEVSAQLSKALQDARALLKDVNPRVTKEFPKAAGIKKNAAMVEPPVDMRDGSTASLWTIKHRHDFDAVQQILDIYASLPNTSRTAEKKMDVERRLQEWLQLGAPAGPGASRNAADSDNPVRTLLQETVRGLQEQYEMVREEYKEISGAIEGLKGILAGGSEIGALVTAQDFHERLSKMQQKHDDLSEQFQTLERINRLMAGESDPASPATETEATTEATTSLDPANMHGVIELSLEEDERDFRERQLPELALQLKELTDRIEQFDRTGARR